MCSLNKLATFTMQKTILIMTAALLMEVASSETCTATTTLTCGDTHTHSSTQQPSSQAACYPERVPGKRGPQGEQGRQGQQGIKGQKGEPCHDERAEEFDRKIGQLNRKVRAMNGECLAGMTSGEITDDQIQASSFYGELTDSSTRNGHHPVHARLDKPTNGWAAQLNVAGSWIGVDLLESRFVQGVVVQGRHLTYDQWVTSLKILYGDDANDLGYITDKGGAHRIFAGSADRNTHQRVIFEREVRARFIRIEPVTWQGHITMRFEIISC